VEDIIRTPEEIKKRPRIAASSYLNTAPLIWSFIKGSQSSRVDLITDAAPARCADMLAHALVDAALVPVIEYQRIPEIELVRGVCVGAKGRVRSVVLVTKNLELKDVQTVALDISSRTSVALCKIIFREFIQHEPKFSSCMPDLRPMIETHDAALIIGDPAMTFSREGLHVYDLATLWYDYTGLGFVFAMWMARTGEPLERVKRIDFAKARNEGLEHINEIVEEYRTTLNRDTSDLEEYLLHNIHFTLDKEMYAGLELFYQLAYKHGLIPTIQPLKMIEI
jgi:chorismate dehydratase